MPAHPFTIVTFLFLRRNKTRKLTDFEGEIEATIFEIRYELLVLRLSNPQERSAYEVIRIFLVPANRATGKRAKRMQTLFEGYVAES